MHKVEKSKAILISTSFKKQVSEKKSLIRIILDFIFVPVRFFLPDGVSEFLGLTCLRNERMRIVIKHMKGRCLDIGCNDNLLINVYESLNKKVDSQAKDIGIDIVDWGGDALIVPSTSTLPFNDSSFDTVTIVASLNHIPERKDTLKEVFRVLKPEGIIIITMINKWVGLFCHKIRFWGEHNQRTVQEGEVFGMSKSDINLLLKDAKFTDIQIKSFLYGLNTVFIARKQII